MIKIYHSEELGSIYWLDGDALMFAQIPAEGCIDLADGGEVDKELIRGEISPNGKYITDIYADIERELSNHCPRCIEDHEGQQGEEVEAHCSSCNVCKECEHLIDCNNN